MNKYINKFTPKFTSKYSKCPKCGEEPATILDNAMGYMFFNPNKSCKNCSQPLKLNIKSYLLYFLVHMFGVASIIPITIILWKFGGYLNSVYPDSEKSPSILFGLWVIYGYSLNYTIPYLYGKISGKSLYEIMQKL